MFENLQPIQIFNAFTNIFSMLLMFPVLFTILTYKRRAQRKYEELERHLDKILLLTNELYQSDIKEKEKAIILDQEPTVVGPATKEIRTKITSRV